MKTVLKIIAYVPLYADHFTYFVAVPMSFDTATLMEVLPITIGAIFLLELERSMYEETEYKTDKRKEKQHGKRLESTPKKTASYAGRI
jgi:hypothetical protein